MSDLARVTDTSVRHSHGEKHTIQLAGCAPVPLASYLKALGIFRLVAEQQDTDAQGWWQSEQFFLRSRLSMEDLQHFFLYEYEPTPILSPWSGRAGFLEGEADGSVSTRKGARILRELESSTAQRFQGYRALVTQARANGTLAEMDRIKAEQNHLKAERKKKGVTAAERAAIDERMKALDLREKTLKEMLLGTLRAELPEATVDWIDTCFAVADDIRAGALLGTGGNEGSMDFSINHLDTLLQMFDRETGRPRAGLQAVLMGALTGETVQQWDGVNPGLLAPSSLGGPNMGAGFEGALHENPWDAVLMLEGALLFSATVTRRHGASPGGGLSFPFALAAVNAGHGGVSRVESSRPEIWAPLWEAPAILDELTALFAEGRITIRRRPARNALDAARAVSQLGVDRGIRAFQRFGFFERRGQGYYVTVPLERRRASAKPKAALIDELDTQGWLTNFRRLATAKGTPARLLSLIRGVEDAIFQVTGSHGDDTHAVQTLLAALGAAQLYLAHSPKARETCSPVPPLRERWVDAADDGSQEYRLAVALAGLHGKATSADGRAVATLPMAVHFAPLEMPAWWTAAWDTTSQATNRVVWGPGVLELNLFNVMRRRAVEANMRGVGRSRSLRLSDKPFASWSAVPLSTVDAWLQHEIDGRKLERLLPALSLVELRPDANQFCTPERSDGTGLLPLSYMVLKLLFCTDEQLRRAGVMPKDVSLPLLPEISLHLAAGRVDDALRVAMRRLRMFDLATQFRQVTAVGMDARTLMAGLLIPITDAGLRKIVRALQENDRTKE